MKITKIILIILVIAVIALQFVPNKMPENTEAGKDDLISKRCITGKHFIYSPDLLL